MARLLLERPIIFFDLETTGTNVITDRIVELSFIKVYPDGTEESRTRRLNPERQIPAEATNVHGITDADVADCPTFKEVSQSLKTIFEGCDIAGFNSNRFDVPMLDQEFRRAGIRFDFSKVKFVDVQTIFHKKEQRTLVAAYHFYCDKNLEDAHSALADTRATYEVLLAQLDRYTDLPQDIAGLSEFSTQKKNVDFMGRLVYDDQGREIINFGKYKGQPALQVLRQDPSYLEWIRRGDFPQNTKDAFDRIAMRIKAANNRK